MSTMNVCILLGRLKDDPTVQRHSSGIDIASMTIEEVVMQREGAGGAPVERTIHHEIRIFNSAFVGVVKAEGARGRHVEVHGSLSYDAAGKAFVAVPPGSGRVAFKTFEVREVPHEPPAIVGDVQAARELATVVSRATAPAPEAEPVEEPQQAAGIVEQPANQDMPTEPEAPADQAPAETETGTAPETEAAPPPAVTRPAVGARPPVLARPVVGGVRQPSPAPQQPQPQQSEQQAKAPPPVRPASISPPPSRPSVGAGGVVARPSGVGQVAGMAQPRPQAGIGPRVGVGSAPTAAVRPPLVRPVPVAAVGGAAPRVAAAGGVGRVVSPAPARTGLGSSKAWDQDEDIPF